MKEEDLYRPVKEFFENHGYKVNGEVKHCDVTAVKDDELIIIELKKSLNIELLIQGLKRQKLSRDVYIAIPKTKKTQKRKELNDIIYLLRRIELGLLLVDVDKNKVEMIIEPKPVDMEMSRKRNKKRANILVNEINKRTMDLNTGGCTGKKLVTVYKEQAIMIACILEKYGELRPAEVRKYGGDDKKTPSILKRNFYKWFESVDGGKYKLTQKGSKELDGFVELKKIFFKKITENNKILYISDLDGTLLGSDAQISQNTEAVLNKLIAGGGKFTVATARTPGTVIDILKNVNIDIPIISMNGVVIYDLKNNEYIKVNGLSKMKTSEIINVLQPFEKSYFMYTLDENNNLVVYYKEVMSKTEVEFLDERLKSRKIFIQTDNYKKYAKNNVIYFAMLGSYEELSEIYGKLSEVKNIAMAFYKNNYSDEWFLEIFNIKANKKAGMEFVMQQLNSKYSVAFGDNLNDIDFMKAANKSYAVSNAHKEVLEIASGVIGCNDEDGVVRFIEERERSLLFPDEL